MMFVGPAVPADTYSMTARPDLFGQPISVIECVVGRDMSPKGLVIEETTLSRIEETGLREALAEYCSMPANWDGYGALPITADVVSNCQAALKPLVRQVWGAEISPNPNGTISLEWVSDHGMAHLEIGKTRFSFFVKPTGGEAMVLDGEANAVPPVLGGFIRAIVFPPLQSVAALTNLEYATGYKRASF